MNNTIKKTIAKVIGRNQAFLISTHVSPDPDALSSELAVAYYLNARGKTVHIINEESVPQRYTFMPGTSMIKKYSDRKKWPYDVAIIVDCGELSRIGKVENLIDLDKPVINIDHHVTNTNFGDVNLVIRKASSTAEVLYELLKSWRAKITKNMAINLYLGIMTDTGSFRYESTSSRTHQIVGELLKHKFSVTQLYKRLYESIPLADIKNFTNLLSSFESHCQGRVVFVELPRRMVARFSQDFDLRDKIFQYLRSIRDVELVAIFTEHQTTVTRVNFRSQGHIDVSKLAHSFDGGGHKQASGCVINDDLNGAKNKILFRVRSLL
jgi:phosphoesterase RecJ-like protein